MAGIIEFYKGQNIFITEASGFIGKALVEKLLRSCPDIGNIYILLRPKKGKDIYERLQDILSDPLYDTLKRDNPENLTKIIPMKGDCSKLELNLSAEDRKLLIEEVSVVFHGAASVRFDDPLKSAIILNTRGTQEIMLLAKSIKNLKVHVHISTAYVNCDRPEVDEVMYPAPVDWREFINVAENTDDTILNSLTEKIIGNHSNTYTFSKCLAEHVVKDLGENMPVVIIRPSIIICVLEDPLPGWIDNFKGPVGLLLGAGKGLIRTFYGDPDVIADYVPVDAFIKCMILTSWVKAISGDTSEPSVYHSSANKLLKFTAGEVQDIGFECCRKIPLNDVLWWPSSEFTKNKIIFKVKVVLYHILPGMILDGILKLSGKKPRLISLHRKIYYANMALSFFMFRSWTFHNNKLLALRSKILPCDQKEFKLDHLEYVDQVAYLANCVRGGRLLLKEYPDTLPKARKHLRRMYWIDRITRALVLSSALWFVYQKYFSSYL